MQQPCILNKARRLYFNIASGIQPLDPLFKTYKVRLETTSQVKDAVAEFTLTEGGIAGLKKLNQQAHLRIHLIMDDLMIEKPA